MNELLIVLAFIPLGFLGFTEKPKFIRGGIWISVIMAATCFGYFLSLHLDAPLVWGPILSFFVMLAADAISRKSFSLFTVLAGLFVAQALLANEMSVILILIGFADMFLVVEFFSAAPVDEKNRGIGNVYRSVLSLCPAALGVLLDLPADLFTLLVCLTVILRLFSWPFAHWARGPMQRVHQLVISGGSTFALWHILDLSAHPEWAMIWLILAAVFSIGAGYIEIYLALTLGLFSISPALGVLGTAFWPLLVHQGKTKYLVVLGVGAIGALIADSSPKVFVENIDYGLCGLCAIALARVFVSLKENQRLWYHEAINCVLALGLCGCFVYMIPMSLPGPGPLAITFAAVFLVALGVGFLLARRKGKWFLSRPPLRLSADGFAGFVRLDERPGRPIKISSTVRRLKVFEMIESESHLIWLLGLLGAVILWGRR